MKQRFDVKEIELALNYLKKKTNAPAVRMEFDEKGRLIMAADDIAASEFKVTLYNNGPDSKFAETSVTTKLSEKVESTETQRLSYEK